MAHENASYNIKPLLQSLKPKNIEPADGDAAAIALAVSQIFTNQLQPAQTAVLLDRLALNGLDQRSDVLAKCAIVMREAAEPVDVQALRDVATKKNLKMGAYEGGLVRCVLHFPYITEVLTVSLKCDIVGTGGDGHSTFNISTASSIIASSLLLVAKHGNRASTSRSGSSDVLSNLKTPQSPKLENVTASTLPSVYEESNYAFLFAPNFHKGFRHVSSIRKELPEPSIFNLLGPLTNPAGPAIEASVIGVKAKGLVRPFAEALRLNGAKKALVVCGDEDLDEVSCAGPTHCSMVLERSRNAVEIEDFMLHPSDFGLPSHPLSSVSPGLTPEENGRILTRLLNGDILEDDPILHFVLMNTASLFVISGICDRTDEERIFTHDPIIETGPGRGRWKEGIRLARHAISTGSGWDMLKKFANATNG
ncbi:MAG: anthranilate phosphoribosyltransferase [Alyxoria varia]|nr:MAG: anthranilate phosphoribosyltransferase [Alyxoria varia]